MCLLLLCLILGISSQSINVLAECTLPLPRYGFFAPLIFSSDGNLLPTANDNEHALEINVPSNVDLILSCAPNYFKTPIFNASKWLTARCTKDETFEIDGLEYNWIVDLGCEVRAVEEIIKPIEGCVNGSTSVEFGYENPIKQHTHIIGEACYSERNGHTIFVHTKFVLKHNKKAAILETENVNYLGRSHPDSKYKVDLLVAARLDDLNKRLEDSLSTKKIPFLELRHFIDLPMLQNGQLYSILKLGWNFVVTNGYDYLPNYDLILKDIMSYDKGFELYLGTHSVLSLNNKKVYLLPNESKHPVPAFLWIVMVTESDKGVAFLVSNDIEAKEEDLIDDAPCQNKCDQLSWMSNLNKNNQKRVVRDGYVFCCDLDSFISAVPEMPSLEGKFDLLTNV